MEEVVDAVPEGGVVSPPDGEAEKVTYPEWMADLPDDLKGEKCLQTVPDAATLAKNYVHAQRKIGEKGVIRPKDDAPPEDWNEYYAALGRPETADKYELKPPDDYPKEFYSEEMAGEYKKWAHEVGLTDKQAKAIFEKYLSFNAGELGKMQKGMEEAKNNAESILKKEWGDQYGANLDLANRVIRQYGDPVVKESIKNGDPLWNDHRLARFLVNIGKSVSEDILVKGSSDAASSLDSQIRDLERSEAYLDNRHMDHKYTIGRLKELYAMKYPEPKE